MPALTENKPLPSKQVSFELYPVCNWWFGLLLSIKLPT
jgi:hypothetical protein